MEFLEVGLGFADFLASCVNEKKLPLTDNPNPLVERAFVPYRCFLFFSWVVRVSPFAMPVPVQPPLSPARGCRIHATRFLVRDISYMLQLLCKHFSMVLTLLHSVPDDIRIISKSSHNTPAACDDTRVRWHRVAILHLLPERPYFAPAVIGFLSWLRGAPTVVLVNIYVFY